MIKNNNNNKYNYLTSSLTLYVYQTYTNMFGKKQKHAPSCSPTSKGWEGGDDERNAKAHAHDPKPGTYKVLLARLTHIRTQPSLYSGPEAQKKYDG